MALGYLRQASKSIWAKLLLIVLGLSFAVWGIGDVFRGNQDRAVAVLGGTEIGINDFAQQYNRQVQIVSNEIGQRVTPDMARSMGLTQQVLNKMLSQMAVKKHAAALGITASDNAVKEAIYEIDAFQGVGQKFDKEVYQSMLQQNNLNRLQFEASVRGDIMRGQIIDVIATGLPTPKGMAEMIYQFRVERRKAGYILLSPDLVGTIETPAEETLVEFHQINSILFTKPEFRALSYFVLQPSDFLDTVNVTEEDIVALYERRKPQYTTPETREVRRLFGTEEEITVALARAKISESFEAIGLSLGMTLEEINLGSIEERGINDPIVAKAAFEMALPGISTPIDGTLSWSLVQVISIKPEVVRPFSELREELLSELSLRDATDVLFTQIDIIEEEIASGTSVEDIAKKVGIEVTKVAQVSAGGADFNGEKVTGLPEDPKFLQEAFASPQGFESDLVGMDGNEYFVLRVDAITPSAITPFISARDEVLSKWRQQERDNRLEAMAQDIVRRSNEGVSLETLGDELGRGVLTSPTPMARTQTSELFSETVVRQLFRSEVGDLIYGHVGVGSSLIVARLDEVVISDGADSNEIVGAFQQQISSSVSNDMIEQYLRGLIDRYGVQRNENAIMIATGEIAPNQ